MGEYPERVNDAIIASTGYTGHIYDLMGSRVVDGSKVMEKGVPLALNAAGLIVPEPSLILPTPFKAFVGWRVGG